LKARAASVIAAATRRLPLEGAVAVKERLDLWGRLDHPRLEIEMRVDTEIDRFRLASCAKEPETVAWVEEHVRPGDAFYDVGANVGAYALIAGRLVGPAGRVCAFEPGFATYATLAANVLRNDLGAVVYALNIALSDTTGLAPLTYSSLRSGAALHSFGDGSAPAGDAPTQMVAGFRLDELVARLGLPTPTQLKLDVDGSELAVLRGAGNLLADSRLRTLLVEVEEGTSVSDSIDGLMQACDLHLTQRHFHARSGVTNVIYTR
jgi:FkbM family methyltransferase